MDLGESATTIPTYIRQSRKSIIAD